MRKNSIAIIAVLILAVWGIYDYSKDRTATNNEQQTTEEVVVGIKKGNMAPDFELLNITGQPMKLSDFAGKKVILNYWATWCPPCRAEMPHMEKIFKDNEEDVVVLAVNLTNTEQNRDQVSNFVEDFGLTFPIVMDEKGDVSSTYQVIAYPTTYIIDSQGIIQEVFQGAINYDIMEKAISRIE